MNRHIIYECGICDCYHPWDWDGDCRDDANRYASDDDYAERNHIDLDSIEVRSMDERIEADCVGCPTEAGDAMNLFHPNSEWLADCIACRTCARVLCRMFGWHWHEIKQHSPIYRRADKTE